MSYKVGFRGTNALCAEAHVQSSALRPEKYIKSDILWSRQANHIESCPFAIAAWAATGRRAYQIECWWLQPAWFKECLSLLFASHCRMSQRSHYGPGEGRAIAPATERIWGWVWGSWVTTRMNANDIEDSVGACGRGLLALLSITSGATKSNRSIATVVSKTQEMIVGSAYHRCSCRRLRHVSSNGEIAASCAGKAYFLRVKIPLVTLPFQESRATDGDDALSGGVGR